MYRDKQSQDYLETIRENDGMIRGLKNANSVKLGSGPQKKKYPNKVLYQ